MLSTRKSRSENWRFDENILNDAMEQPIEAN